MYAKMNTRAQTRRAGSRKYPALRRLEDPRGYRRGYFPQLLRAAIKLKLPSCIQGATGHFPQLLRAAITLKLPTSILAHTCEQPSELFPGCAPEILQLLYGLAFGHGKGVHGRDNLALLEANFLECVYDEMPLLAQLV